MNIMKRWVTRERGFAMKKYEVERTSQADIRFDGEMLAEVSSETLCWRPADSNLWTELTLYKTKGGSYVAQKVKRTWWQGEREFNDAAVCKDAGEVLDFFQVEDWPDHQDASFPGLAKELLRRAAEVDEEFKDITFIVVE